MLETPNKAATARFATLSTEDGVRKKYHKSTVARMAIAALGRNPMRAMLTALGIIIGVGAVIAMMEISRGASVAIQVTVTKMGANTLAVLKARLNPPWTALSSVTKKAPWLDLSIDQVSIMNQGCVADGSKAERELGIHYTPMHEALADAVANP